MVDVTAVVWHGPRDLRIRRWPLPAVPGDGWVRLEVAWCGLCGSDVAEYDRGPLVIPTEPHPLSGRSAPLVLGHEISGTVATLGAGVTSLAVGDSVVTDSLISCGACSRCRGGEVNLCPLLAAAGISADGGLADYVEVPAESCLRVPDGTPLDVAALAEPLAVAVRADRIAARTTDTAVIVGGGGVGNLIAALRADRAEAPVSIVEPSEGRRRWAGQLSDTAAVPSVRELRRSADTPWVAFECSGNADALNELIRVAPARSRIVLVGMHGRRIPLDLHRLLHKELELVGSLSHDRADLRTALGLLSRHSGRFAALITHRTTLDGVVPALEYLTRPDTTAGKILAGPEGTPWTNS